MMDGAKFTLARKCIFVRAYARLKSSGKEDHLDHEVIPPWNVDLNQTSAWINLYLGRDHNAKKYGVKKLILKNSKKAPLFDAACKLWVKTI